MRIIKKISAIMAAGLMSLAITSAVGAEYAEDTNIILDYGSIAWDKDALSYSSESLALSFSATEGKVDYSAEYTFELPETLPRSFWFYVDIGNGQNTSDLGSAEFSFLDKNGAKIVSSRSGEVTGAEKYRRYSLAKGNEFYPVPDNARTVVIALKAKDTDADGKVSVFFRNFSLMFSNTQTISGINSSDLPALMAISDEMSPVEENATFNRWIWIGVVFLVAMIFYFIRLKQRKYKTTEVMKPTYSKRKRY